MLVDQNEIRRPLLRPPVRRDQVAQAEHRQAEREHPVDAHHRRVPVVGGQRRADLVVGDDRQVDQEPEDAGAEEVPEADRDEEHDRPAVRERRLRARLLRRAELQEAPRLDGEERQRDHLRRREERAQGHVLGRLAGEVQVVHRADDAADRVQDDVQEDDRQRDPLAHHAEQHEHVGDHHGREELEEVLHPQVHDPEAPELGRREVVAGARDQADRVERRDRARREEEQPRHVARVLGAQPPAQHAPEHEHPDEQADRQQDLPEPGEVEVLEALQPEPVRRRRPPAPRGCRGRTRSASRRRRRPGRRAARRRACPGACGSRRAIIGARKMPGGDERGGDPEQRQLDVPGAHQVVREHLGQVDAEEVVDLRAVVLAGGADEASGSGTAPPSRRRTRRSRAARA